MKRKKSLYPGVVEAEKERSRKQAEFSEEPDFVGNAPNYDKFEKWPAEKVLAWLNID